MMFKDGDVVCFLGDSITATDLFVSEIYQELRQKYNLKVYNCGVSGSVVSLANDYLYERCLCFNPTYVVTMFGINDINRDLCSVAYKNDPKRVEKIEAALSDHKQQYHAVIEKCLRFGTKVILCVPAPYDEISEVQSENLHCQYLMDNITDYLYIMGKEFNLPVVDYASVLKPMRGMPGLYEPDRVHPTSYGHHVLARTFLMTVGEASELCLDRPFEPEEWVSSRHEQFKIISYIDFVEYCVLYRLAHREHWTVEQKKNEIIRRLFETKIDNPYVLECFRCYVDHIDFYRDEISKLIQLTR